VRRFVTRFVYPLLSSLSLPRPCRVAIGEWSEAADVLAVDAPRFLSETAAWGSYELNRRVSLLVILGLCPGMPDGGRWERERETRGADEQGRVGAGGVGGVCWNGKGGSSLSHVSLLQVISQARAQDTKTEGGVGSGGGDGGGGGGRMRVVAVTDGAYSDASAIAAAVGGGGGAVGGHVHVMSLHASVPPGVSLQFASGHTHTQTHTHTFFHSPPPAPLSLSALL